MKDFAKKGVYDRMKTIRDAIHVLVDAEFASYPECSQAFKKYNHNLGECYSNALMIKTVGPEPKLSKQFADDFKKRKPLRENLIQTIQKTYA